MSPTDPHLHHADAPDETESLWGRLLTMAVTALAAGLMAIILVYKVRVMLSQQRWDMLGLVAFYTLLITLFIIRKPTQLSLASFPHWLVALGGTLTPLALQTTTVSVGLLKWLGHGVEIIGVIASVWSLATLGRGFGIVAAERSIKTHGVYRWVRHPLYASEYCWMWGLLLQHFSWVNVGVAVVALLFQIARMNDEERLLSNNPTYASYLATVRWRLLPGIY